jgi:predicted acetylornithine/succinylornithine family transaminase
LEDPTLTATELSATQQIIDRHDQFMAHNLNRYPIAMVRGEGCRLYDAQGREYLDLFAGFGGSILGHCHPDLVEAVNRQAHQLWHVGNLFHTEPQTRAAEAIARHGFGGLSFFTHCGSDANELALKVARLYGKANPGQAPAPGRFKVISARHSFHGRLFGTMMATGQEKARQGFEPLLPGFAYVPYNDLPALATAIDAQTVALMVEPIQGEGGIHVPDDGYLAGLRSLCREHDLLLIFDEVWTGCGRTGRYFAYQHWGVEPDLMTLAKGVGGGLPVGVLCAQKRVARLLDPKVNHGVVAHATTLGGNCLAMAVAAAVFEVLERDGLVPRAAELGLHALARARRFAADHPVVKAARGHGLMLGIELDFRTPGCPVADLNQVVNRLMDRGILVNGTQDTVIRLAPPLTVTRAQLDQGLDALEAVLTGK